MFRTIVATLVFVTVLPVCVRANGSWVRTFRTDFSLELVESGEVFAVQSRVVPAPREWRSNLQITRMVSEGSMVVAGDTLATFDAAFLDAEIQKVRNQLETLEADLRKRKAEQGAQRVALNNAVTSAHYALEQSELEIEKLEHESESRRMQAELSLKKAHVSLTEATTKLASQITLDSLATQAAHLKIANAKSRLEEEQERLLGMTLTAPISGLVIYGTRDDGGEGRRKLRVGDEVSAGGTVLEIPNLEAMEVRFSVHEVDREKLSLGMPINVSLVAYPENELRATVTHIGRLAESPEEESQVRQFQVRAALDTSFDLLRPELSARLGVVLERREDVVVLPLVAVYERDGDAVVFPRERWPEPFIVEIEAYNDMLAVTVEPLEEDWELAVQPPTDDLQVQPWGYRDFHTQAARWEELPSPAVVVEDVVVPPATEVEVQ